MHTMPYENPWLEFQQCFLPIAEENRALANLYPRENRFTSKSLLSQP